MSSFFDGHVSTIFLLRVLFSVLYQHLFLTSKMIYAFMNDDTLVSLGQQRSMVTIA